MKILQVGLGNNPGGMEAFVMNYFRELARQGVSFDFVSMYGTIAYEKEILELGGRVFYVPNIKKDYFGYIKAFRKLLSREKYDVVHVNMLSAANIVPLRLAKQAGVRKVIAPTVLDVAAAQQGFAHSSILVFCRKRHTAGN